MTFLGSWNTRLVDHGAIYSRVSPWEPYSATEGRLVTGQNPASAQGVAEGVIAILELPKH